MKKYAMETTVGIFLVFGLLCIGYMTVELGHVSFAGRQRLFSLRPIYHGERPESRQSCEYIGYGGRRVGQLTMDQKDQKVVVEIRIQKRHQGL